MATAVNTRDPYSTTYGHLALFDPLTDDTGGYGWKSPDCQFVNHVYYAATSAAQQLRFCDAVNSHFKDFAYQLDMVLIAGDQGCMLFRVAPGSLQKGYAFCIGADGRYTEADLNSKQPGYQINKQDTSPVKINSYNQVNTLGVVVQGNKITLYVNKVQIASIQDTTALDAGSIGAGVLEQGHSTSATFSNVRVWTV
jgi:hypothetical protein